MDEAKMIAYAREGDLDAFNRLVVAYQDIAFNVAYRMLSDRISIFTSLPIESLDALALQKRLNVIGEQESRKPHARHATTLA